MVQGKGDTSTETDARVFETDRHMFRSINRPWPRGVVRVPSTAHAFQGHVSRGRIRPYLHYYQPNCPKVRGHTIPPRDVAMMRTLARTCAPVYVGRRASRCDTCSAAGPPDQRPAAIPSRQTHRTSVLAYLLEYSTESYATTR